MSGLINSRSLTGESSQVGVVSDGGSHGERRDQSRLGSRAPQRRWQFSQGLIINLRPEAVRVCLQGWLTLSIWGFEFNAWKSLLFLFSIVMNWLSGTLGVIYGVFMSWSLCLLGISPTSQHISGIIGGQARSTCSWLDFWRWHRCDAVVFLFSLNADTNRNRDLKVNPRAMFSRSRTQFMLKLKRQTPCVSGFLVF